jgi:RES domain-containing protein
VSQGVWRIATDTPDYEADDLAGTGAERTGGRWNRKGMPMVYASESIAMACLETFVHLAAVALPFNRYLVRIDIPDAVWAAAERLSVSTAPIGWDALPAGRASIAYGAGWLAARRSAVLLVPSTIAPEEGNVLINPLHPDAAGITATKLRKWLYDPRMGRM